MRRWLAENRIVPRSISANPWELFQDSEDILSEMLLNGSKTSEKKMGVPSAFTIFGDHFKIMDNQSFFTKVYELVKLVPRGRVTSYGAIARFLGAAKSARLVGYAMNAASKMDDVPAHRVVNRNGLLTGKHHFPGTYVMQQMLEEEGIEVKDDKVLGFSEVFWDPSRQL